MTIVQFASSNRDAFSWATFLPVAHDGGCTILWSVGTLKTTRRHIPNDRNRRSYRREGVRFRLVVTCCTSSIIWNCIKAIIWSAVASCTLLLHADDVIRGVWGAWAALMVRQTPRGSKINILNARCIILHSKILNLWHKIKGNSINVIF
jgi:hypothetical protein